MNNILLKSGELVEIDFIQNINYITDNIDNIESEYIGGFGKSYNTGLYLLHKSGKLIRFNEFYKMIDYFVNNKGSFQSFSLPNSRRNNK